LFFGSLIAGLAGHNLVNTKKHSIFRVLRGKVVFSTFHAFFQLLAHFVLFDAISYFFNFSPFFQLFAVFSTFSRQLVVFFNFSRVFSTFPGALHGGSVKLMASKGL
jgi:hypothetical protein